MINAKYGFHLNYVYSGSQLCKCGVHTNGSMTFCLCLQIWDWWWKQTEDNACSCCESL